MAMCAFTGFAQNRWNVYAGGSISHYCSKPWMSSDKSYSWGGGAFLGAGYEVNFNSHWSLTPQVEFMFDNNGATLDSKENSFSSNHESWLQTFNFNIPLIASYRFAISKNAGLRLGVGPYLQYTLAGRRYKYNSDIKENIRGGFGDRINVGILGEAAIETGSHFSYMFRVHYPFLKEGVVKKTLVLSLGVGYSF